MARKKEDKLMKINEKREKNKISHVYQHSVNLNNALVVLLDLTSINSAYKHDQYKKKISEALFMKSKRPKMKPLRKSFSVC